MDRSEPSSPVTDDEDEFELVTRKRGKRIKEPRSNSTTTSNDGSGHNSSYARVISKQRGKEVKLCSNILFGDDSDGKLHEATERMDMVHLDAQLINLPNIIEEAQNIESPKIEVEQIETVREESGEEIGIANRRPLSQYAATYELEKFEKNAMLIFNHVNVDGYPPRLGTEKDVTELERTFKNFGFEVQIEEDLRREQIMDKLREFTSRDFTDYGCVAVVVLSHGSRDGRIKAKDMPYSELEIVNQLQVHNKPTLLTKPRLFIVQACRGMKDIKGVTVGRAYRIQKDLVEEIEPYTLPVEADMLVLHSSYIGKPSHRHELHGSWFIQSLCSKINEYSTKLDFEAILTEVKKEVAIDKCHVERNRRTAELDTNKQMPVSTSTLTRKLYLKRFGASSSPAETVSDSPARSQPNLSVLDSSAPTTPMLPYTPCACFLDHFAYIKKCLSHYLIENPEDVFAQHFLSLADTFDDDVKFFGAKEETAKLICQHLKDKGKDSPYYKYLYFYKH